MGPVGTWTMVLLALGWLPERVETIPGMPEKHCNSLSGPYCAFMGLNSYIAAKRDQLPLPDSASDDIQQQESALKAMQSGCFFRHFTRSWMDANGDHNDLLSQQVESIEACERLCCMHPRCQSYTFWNKQTCFLRAKANIPREESNSFSANRIR